jgi:Na+-transporting NADH:ubiquinone oxidoreductase subunit C
VHSNKYIITFVFILTAVVALVLSGMSTFLKETHELNEAIFNKRAILSAIQSEFETAVKDMPDDQIVEIFSNQMKQMVVDANGGEVTSADVEARGYKGGQAEHIKMDKEKKKPVSDRIFPVFIYEKDGEKIYILSIRGNGLWDEIWGNIALKDDFETVVGAAFDHKGETPGLGAEIKDNPSFASQFTGKMITDETGEYTSVVVRKGGAKNMRYELDGISGATVTADGVTKMLFEGIQYYHPYFKNIKPQG